MGKSGGGIVAALNPVSALTGVLPWMQYKEGKKQEKAARTAADQQKDANNALAADFNKRKEEENKKASKLASRNALISSRRYSAPSNRGGTILTSPLGLTGNTGYQGGKTLLGT